MNLQDIQQAIPDYAKDIRLNLSSLINSESALTKQQHWGTLLACSIACKNKRLIDAINEQATTALSVDAIAAAKSAATLMAMTNVYYRFTHLTSNQAYQRMPANLRMSAMAQPGIEKIDFELFSLAVSAINGCGKCIDAHEVALKKHGVAEDVIHTAIRIASIIHATAMTLETL